MNRDMATMETIPPPPPGSQGSGLRARIIAAGVLAPLVLALVWAGGAWFTALLLLAAALMAREWTTITHEGDGRQFLLHLLAGGSAVLAGVAVGEARATLLLAAALGWLASLILVARRRAGFSTWNTLGIPWLVAALFSMSALRASGDCGLLAIVLLLAAVWTADSLAYFTGRALGGPKLAPRISPNKTWAGFLGAVAGGAAGAALVALLAGHTAWPLLLLGAVLGGWEQLGDLFESAWKRHFGVKDSGRLIPGHGGILDRVDGLMAAAVLALAWGWWQAGTLRAAACGLFA